MLVTLLFEREFLENIDQERRVFFDNSSALTVLTTSNLTNSKVTFFLIETGKQTFRLIPSEYPSCGFSKHNVSADEFEKEYNCEKIVICFDLIDSSITVSRDHFGIVPCFYLYIPNLFLVVSDNIKELFAFATKNQLPCGVNREKLVRYISTGVINAPYSEDTFFSTIKSVLPGYKVEFTKTDRTSSRYLSFHVSKWTHLERIEEFGDLFRNLFKSSVQKAIADSGTVGGQLSGGMDSSSVISMARHLLPDSNLFSFFIQENTESPPKNSTEHDTYYSGEVAKHLKTEHQVINIEDGYLDALKLMLEITYQPPLMMGNHTTLLPLLARAKALNIDTLLTGYDGDGIVGYGDEYLTEVFENQDWLLLKSALLEKPLLRKHPTFKKRVFTTFLFKAIKYQYRRGGRKYIKPLAMYEACKTLKVSPLRLMSYIMVNGWEKIIPTAFFSTIPKPIVDMDRQSCKEYDENINSVVSGLSSEQLTYFSRILVNQNVRMLEEYYALGKYYDINIKFPFFSKELYELCLAVPNKLNYHNGYGRGAMRVGLRGILTESVRTRSGKTTGDQKRWKNRVLKLIEQSHEYLMPDNEIWQYVNREAFFYNVDLLSNSKTGHKNLRPLIFQANRVVYSAVWLAMIKKG